MASSPLIVVPTTTSVPPCSGLSRRGLETTERAARAERRPTLTAPVRVGPQYVWVGAEKRDSKSNKETGMKEGGAWCKKRCLTYPIQGLLGVHSRYGLHTRAVTVYRDAHPEGFSYFVTSIAAPVASGWSNCRVGLTPTGKRRLSTAHTRCGLRRCIAVFKCAYSGRATTTSGTTIRSLRRHAAGMPPGW
jgi:hypothetical protein